MYLARLTPYQLCRPSNRLHCPEKRLEKLLMGVGVLSRLSAKSAAVKLCWRSLVPKTNTGSLPRTALSVNMIFGNSGERDSRTAASRNAGARHGRLVQRVLLQRHADRLRQRERRAQSAPLKPAREREQRALRIARQRAQCSAQRRDDHCIQQRLAVIVPETRRHPYAPTNAAPSHGHNLEGGVQFGAQLHHGADRAVLLFRQPDGIFDRLGRNVIAGHDVMNADLGKDLRRVQASGRPRPSLRSP